MTTLREIKNRTTINDLWRYYQLPGMPGPSCYCPFHANSNTPAFSIFNDGRAFKCFAGCGQGGQIEFISLRERISNSEACRRLIEIDGNQRSFDKRPVRRSSRNGLNSLQFSIGQGTQRQRERVSKNRNFGSIGLNLAIERGLVGFGRHGKQEAWLVTDKVRINAQARRVDGMPWITTKGRAVKALTLRGSKASWPIGIKEAESFENIALVEGGPDLVAALSRIWFEDCEDRWAPVAMLGAANRIAVEAIPNFRGKRVRIFGHADVHGEKAVRNWSLQLSQAGAHVDAFRFDGLRRIDGKPVNDFNDLCLLDPKMASQVGRILS